MEHLYHKRDIIDQASKIAEMISNSEEVRFFQRAEIQVDESETIQQLINKIKRLQKEAVNLQHYGKNEALKLTEDNIKASQAELDQIPLVNQYKQSQMDVNHLLQLVVSTISNTIAEELEQSTESR